MESDKKLRELFYLLESSYTCRESSKLKEITQLIKELSLNFEEYLNLLFKGLSLISFNNNQISLDLHKCMAINLKNTIMEKEDMNADQKFILLQKIFQLFFTINFNPNLLNESIINTFVIVVNILASESIKTHLEDLFQILSKEMSDEQSKKEDFINRAKIVIKFSRGLFNSKALDKDNFSKIFIDYYIIIIDIIFKNVPIFIDPNKNIYCEDYFCLLTSLIEDMYLNLKIISKIDCIDKGKFHEFIENFFQKYYPFVYELIKIQIPFDEKSQKIFNNQNSIISFNLIDKKNSEINNMKSKCFQLFAYLTEQLSFKEKTNFNDYKNIIKNEKLIEINAELIKMIISSLQDILTNKEKFQLIKRLNEENYKFDKCYNALLYNMILFSIRSLIREPIKSEFSNHIKYFVLNIVFPLITSSEEEKLFLEEEPDTYQTYLNDLLYNYKFRNFRTALCFLIKKIFDNYLEIHSFMLSYIIEMLNYIFKMYNNNINGSNKYNIYLDNENKSLLNNFNDEIKIDFCFLIILILKDSIIKNNSMKTRFFTFLFQNQNKIHQITSSIILIKICRIYKDYYIHLFKFLNQEKDILIKKSYIENMINFILGLIINNNKYNDIKSTLVYEASQTILKILKFCDNSNMSNYYIKEIVIDKLKLCFKCFVKLIDMIDNSSLNIVISNIIGKIHINERQDIIKCLENYTAKLKIIVNTNYKYLNKEDELRNKTLFISQYFNIIQNYLKGENKLGILNQNELFQFNKIIFPIISYVSQPKKYSFYEDIVTLGEYYIKALNSINEISIQILNSLYTLINLDKILSENYFSFLSTFLEHIYKNKNYEHYLFKLIEIIKLAFSFQFDNFSEDILFTLLLNLQIFCFEGQINYEILKYFILGNIKLYFYYFVNLSKKRLQEIIFENNTNTINKFEQILAANISLSFIYYPDNALKIIKENFGEIINKESNIKNLSDLIIKLYSSVLKNINYYNSNLGKCDLLCLCNISRNSTLFNSIFDDRNKKILFLKLLIKFTKKHKDESVKNKNKLTNDKKLNCDFINSDEEKNNSESDLDADEREFDNNFFQNVKNCMKNHNIINNNDEFKFFSETFYLIKSSDEDLYDELLSNFENKQIKMINDLLFVRNIKIEYNGKQVEVPRRTLKIQRKNQ